MPDIFTTNKQPGKKPIHPPPSEKKAEQPQGQEPPIITPYVSSPTMFSAFGINPKGVSFESQEANEQVVLFMRAHFITNLPWIFTSIMLFLIPILLAIMLNISIFDGLFPALNIPDKYTLVFVLFYYLIVFAFIFISFITWFYNIGLVTQIRVVDIDYSDIIFHNVAVTKLNLIEDVNYTQSGFIQSLFSYGDVHIQTAGEVKHFEFPRVPNPARAVDLIQDLIGGRPHG